MASKARRINPALIAALEHYAEGRYDPAQPSMYVHTDERGHQSPWPIERTCGIAAELLADEELNFLKLKTLQDGLKAYGLSDFYKKVTGENLPGAQRLS